MLCLYVRLWKCRICICPLLFVSTLFCGITFSKSFWPQQVSLQSLFIQPHDTYIVIVWWYRHEVGKISSKVFKHQYFWAKKIPHLITQRTVNTATRNSLCGVNLKWKACGWEHVPDEHINRDNRMFKKIRVNKSSSALFSFHYSFAWSFPL